MWTMFIIPEQVLSLLIPAFLLICSACLSSLLSPEEQDNKTDPRD